MKAILHRYRREVLVLGFGVLYILGSVIGQHLSDNTALIRVLDNARWTADCLLASLLTFLGWREAASEDRRARRWFFLGWFIYTIGQISLGHSNGHRMESISRPERSVFPEPGLLPRHWFPHHFAEGIGQE
jgi:hypothetical protein